MAAVSISFTSSAANYNIASLGADDWALWNSGGGSGATNVAPSQRKSGGGSLIGNATCTVASMDGFSAAIRTASWTGGTPTASGGNTNGIYNNRNNTGTSNNGADISVTFPADTTTRQAWLYLDTYNGAVTLTATLSDGSAGPATNTSLTVTGGALGGFYLVTYSAASASQTLTLKAVAAANGAYADVELQGAAVKASSSSTTTATAAAGTATVSAVGKSTAVTTRTAAAGVATVSAVGRSTAATTATAAAGVGTVSTVSAVSVSLTTASQITGTATVSATAQSSAATTAGQAAGLATVSGSGASLAGTTATAADGVATVSGTSAVVMATTATAADGVATVSSMVGAAVKLTDATPIAGTSSVSGTAQSTASSSAVSADGSATVSATSSYLGDAPSVRVGEQYEWDWGDGNTSNTMVASHTYLIPGTYNVSFRAKNHIGWSEKVYAEVTVPG